MRRHVACGAWLLRRAAFWLLAVILAAAVTRATAAETQAPDHCPLPISIGTPSAAISTPVVLRILPSTYWQPVGGDIKFELDGLRQPPTMLDVYFVWKDIPGHAIGVADGGTPASERFTRCRPSGRVYQIHSTDPAGSDLKTYTYAARVPDMDVRGEFFLGIEGIRHWSGLVPQADMYVSATVLDDASPPKPITILLPTTVGVTTPWISFVFSAIIFVLGGIVLSRWSTLRGVKGDWVLRIISTPTGVASLSQFQIIIWTAVIGTGVLYVMLLSGNLIDVPAPTLELLGVTGLALVGSKLVTGTDGSPLRASTPGTPGAPALVGQAASTSVTLTWSPPDNAGAPVSYSVEKRQGGVGPWVDQGRNIGVPPYTVGGLSPGSSYEFRILASYGDSGPGPASAVVPATTAAAAAVLLPGPAIVLKTPKARASANVLLEWETIPLAPPVQPSRYVIAYRKAGSLPWITYANDAASPRTTTGDLFEYATCYEFQVYSMAGSTVSATSNIEAVTMIKRVPLWSDLVMSSRANAEVDMARVQMLIFTSIAAAFTALTVINIWEIPTIPGGELALIGLSNGVYLSSKAVRERGRDGDWGR